MLGNVCVLGLALALVPAAAYAKSSDKAKRHKETTQRVSKDPFGEIPKGPLHIIISINQQKLHLYSNGKHVTDALVATGVPGHPTPMGMFSVIEKDRYHHSNIYSGAPMPYMQRITWSGVAIHEGVGLGHPASHGCIRMPREFAARLWVLTRLGARVIIARPELKPVDFSDPHLFVHKEKPPAPTAAAPIAGETIKTAQTVDTSRATDSTASAALPLTPAELRTTIAPLQSSAPVMTASSAVADTPLAAANEISPLTHPAELDPAPRDTNDVVAPPAHPDAADPSPKPGSAPVPKPQAASEPAKVETVTPTPAAISRDDQSAAPAPAEPNKPVEIRTDPIATPEVVPVPQPKPAQLTRAAAPKPIAIFVSRKEKKIYVRQNFSPLFEAAITIDHPERPLGTHLFTAMEYLDDGASFRWTLVSLPGELPKAARNAKNDNDNERNAKGKRKHEPAKVLADPQPPETPSEALARLDIPQDVIEQISALIIPGSSFIISDQGLGQETGKGTDFIVVSR